MAPTFKVNPIRCFQAYTSEQRANHRASFRLGYLQRQAVGHFYYVHPAVPGIAFDTAAAAKRAALEQPFVLCHAA